MSFSIEERGNPNTLSYRVYFSKYEFFSSGIGDEKFARSVRCIKIKGVGPQVPRVAFPRVIYDLKANKIHKFNDFTN